MSTSTQSNAQNQNEKKGSGASEAARAKAREFSSSAADMASDATTHYVKEPAKDLLSMARDYAREKPDVAACWCFALGVIVGWKLKP